jgi:hypothetical protein
MTIDNNTTLEQIIAAHRHSSHHRKELYTSYKKARHPVWLFDCLSIRKF